MEKINPNSYYSADALLAKKDLNNNAPEIFCVCGNRSSGKTTDFSRRCIRGWQDDTFREVMLLKRYVNEVRGSGVSFLNPELIANFFPDIASVQVEEKLVDPGIMKILVDGQMFGWCVALNSADKIKKKSNLFNMVDVMFFDEFMPETGDYCPREIEKIKSIHVSVARGYNQRSRYVPLWMASNLVTLLNPYFDAWNVSSRLSENTRFLRCNGLVVEQNFNKGAAKAQSESSFLAAFGDNEYYTKQGVYLNDNLSMIGSMSGDMSYLCTIKHEDKLYAIKVANGDIAYVDSKVDRYFPRRIASTTQDISKDFLSKSLYSGTIGYLRDVFNEGRFRFCNQLAKDAVFKFLSY